MTRIAILTLWNILSLITLIGCGGSPTPSGHVEVIGVASSDSALSSPLKQAVCRVVDLGGAERAKDDADENGEYLLEVEIGVRGFLLCSSRDFPKTTLSTYITTRGAPRQ